MFIIVSMGRTNIEIDDDLVSKAMRRYGLHSKRAAVDLALSRLAGESMTREDTLAMEGAGREGDLDEMRSNHRGWPGDPGRHLGVGRVPWKHRKRHASCGSPVA